MHPSACSCAPILQFFNAALDGTTANHRILDRIFGHIFTTLRKNSVANYGSIWTLFLPSVRGPDVLCNTLNISVEIFQNVKNGGKVRAKFFLWLLLR